MIISITSYGSLILSETDTKEIRLGLSTLYPCCYIVYDEKKFFLAVIKYGIEYTIC